MKFLSRKVAGRRAKETLLISQRQFRRDGERRGGGVGDGPVCSGLSVTNLCPLALNAMLGLSFSHSSFLPSLRRISHLRENKQAVSVLHFSPRSPLLKPDTCIMGSRRTRSPSSDGLHQIICGGPRRRPSFSDKGKVNG